MVDSSDMTGTALATAAGLLLTVAKSTMVVFDVAVAEPGVAVEEEAGRFLLINRMGVTAEEEEEVASW